MEQQQAGIPFDISQLKDQVWSEVRRAVNLSGNHTESFWDNLQGFIHAVDWKVCAAAVTCCPSCQPAV